MSNANKGRGSDSINNDGKRIEMTQDTIPIRNEQRTAARGWMLQPGNEMGDSLFGGEEADAAQRVQRRQQQRLDARRVIERERSDVRLARELNPAVRAAIHADINDGGTGAVIADSDVQNTSQTTESTMRTIRFGDSGSGWRQMQLRRILDTSKAQNVSPEQLATTRFQSIDEFNFVRREAAFLEKRRKQRDVRMPPPCESSFVYKPRSTSANSEARISAPRPYLPGTVGHKPSELTVVKQKVDSLVTRISKARVAGATRTEISIMEKELAKMRSLVTESTVDSSNSNVLTRPSTRLDAERLITDAGARTGGYQRSLDPSNEHQRLGNKRQRNDDKSPAEHESFAQMLMREKLAAGEDYDASLAHNIVHDGSYTNDTDYLDSRMSHLSKAKIRSATSLRDSAIAEQKRISDALDRCKYCLRDRSESNDMVDDHTNEPDRKRKPGLGSRDAPRNRRPQLSWPMVPVIARGTRTYLALPDTDDMVPFHCLIVPQEHEISIKSMDEDTFTEIRNFQKSLYSMFSEMGKGCIFFEQVLNLNDHRHTVVEVIPVPKNLMTDLPIIFEEALRSQGDSELESSNKKVIRTRHSKGGLRNSVVKGKPYLHIWYDPNEGVAQHIESKNWSPFFTREVIGSMLGFTPDKWRRLPRANRERNAIRRKIFMEKFKNHDWTKMLQNA